jgi:hypothetical protein
LLFPAGSPAASAGDSSATPSPVFAGTMTPSGNASRWAFDHKDVEIVFVIQLVVLCPFLP